MNNYLDWVIVRDTILYNAVHRDPPFDTVVSHRRVRRSGYRQAHTVRNRARHSNNP